MNNVFRINSLKTSKEGVGWGVSLLVCSSRPSRLLKSRVGTFKWGEGGGGRGEGAN